MNANPGSRQYAVRLLTPGLAFLLTALIAVWAAYDRPAAGIRFGLLAGGTGAALGLAWAGRRGGERVLALVGLGCAWLGAVIGAYFVLTHDWQALIAAKIPALNQVGLWIQAHRPVLPAAEDVHSNVASAALAPLWLLGAGAVLHARRRRWPAPVVWAGVATLAAVGGALILTVSRGAWIGTAAGVGLAVYLARRTAASLAADGQRSAVGRQPSAVGLDGLLVLGAVLLAVLLLLAVAPPPALRFLSDTSAAGRPQLWRWGLDLIADYPFTGSGLGSTMMVLSSYVLMLHVGFIHHVHNLYLQVAVEQGLPGLLAFGTLVALAGINVARAYRSRGATPLIMAAAAALVALLVHGVVDAGLYASRLVPLLFVPIGFALGLPVELEAEVKAETRASSPHASGRTPALALISILALTSILTLSLILFLLPATRAVFQANLAAVAQTRAELSVYRWPEWFLQDALRRHVLGSPPPVDLGSVVDRYYVALALDPGNATANRRLGQIELSWGEYEAARIHLEAAYRAAPGQQAVRFLLGEVLAIAGHIDAAATLWRTVGEPAWRNGTGAGVYALRQAWYDKVTEPENRQRIGEAMRLLMTDD
jgi:hypothetical protein